MTDIFHWFMGIGFGPRLCFLAVFFMLMASYDLWRKRTEATRWREYSFAILCGLLGILYGLLNDQITGRISADYFLYGKGIEPWDGNGGFWYKVNILATQAGFVAGLVGGCLLLLVKGENSFRSLAGFLRYPFLGALLGSLLVAALLTWFAPMRLLGGFSEIIDPPNQAGFLSVMGWHYGLYAGFAIGMGVAMFKLRRQVGT